MQAQTLPSDIGKPRRHCPLAARGAKSCAPRVNLFQIAYSTQTFADIESGYRVLDNRANPRPDWYEYWPMREYLLNQPLDDHAFYGFFSTKFHNKTGLTHAEVLDFVEQQAGNADIVLFSPQPDMGALFLNVFEQGELFDPGFIDAFSAYLLAIGRPTKVADLLMDSRHIVFSNYFVAKPAFWREWLTITEKTFAICEGPDCAVKEQLCIATNYPGSVQRKVFVQERIASFLLATQPQWQSVTFNPFGMAWSLLFHQQPHEAYISDALKLAYDRHRYPQYLEAYGAVRERLKSGGGDKASPPDCFAPGQVVAVRHSFWAGYLIVDQKPGRLRHALHGSQASYRLFGKFLLVDWDDYDAELFVRHGEEFRLSTFGRDGRGLDALGQAWTTLGETRLDIESVCVRLPDGMGSAHVRPGTSDIPVLEATCIRRDDDIVGLPDDCDIIVDLGANVGLASIVLAHRYPQATIVAVEPARDNFHLLTRNVLERPRIIAVEAAIAPCDGLVDPRDSVVSGEKSQSWADRTRERGTGLGRYTVEALSIPTLMRRYGLGFVDVLKIDIAGAEHALFAENTAAWLPRVRSIVIETHERLVPGTDALVTAVLRESFVEMPARSGCRFFLRRSWGQGEQ